MKGHTNIPESATFPNGLPGVLGSVAHQAPEAASSESDSGGMQLSLGGDFFFKAILIKPQAVFPNEQGLVTVVRDERAPPEQAGGTAPRGPTQ